MKTVSKLESLIVRHMPQYESPIKKGRVNYRKLSIDLGISRQTMYNILKSGRINGRYVNRLCNVPNTTLTKELLLEFINFD